MNPSLKSFCVALIALAGGYFAGHSTPRQSPPTQAPFALATSEVRIERGSYILSYDGRNKQARWVYENLTAERCQGTAQRTSFHFQEDPLIPHPLRATKEDYAGSGFDRGHLCPAADAKINAEQMKETFFLSNISPQHPEFNRGFWLKLEKRVRSLAQQHGSVHVFTGGLYLPELRADGKKFVTYQVIGNSGVAVPTHFFKIIFKSDQTPLETYILPNAPIHAKTPLKDFLTTLDQVEKSAGVLFF